MKWQTQPLPSDSDAQPVDRLSFDILRLLVANRQAASPTVRALAEHRVDSATVNADPMAKRVRMLAGHSAVADATNDALGAFFAARHGGEPVPQQGERHA